MTLHRVTQVVAATGNLCPVCGEKYMRRVEEPVLINRGHAKRCGGTGSVRDEK